MRKFLVILLVLSPLFLQAHTDHYKNYSKIEMEIFKNITLANDLEMKYSTNSPTLLINQMTVAGK